MPETSPSNFDSPLAASEPPLTRRTRIFLIALFLLTAGIVLFHELGGFRTLGSHEVYAAVPAREMQRSGNWIVPIYGGLPRLRKPPLAYWVLSTSATIFGEFNEWVVRVPAAASAFLLAILTGFWASRWYGKTAGWAAAFAQLTCIWVLIFSRKAEIDMMLCLFTTAAMFLVGTQPKGESFRKGFVRWIGVWALISLAWLGKFHYGPAMVIAPCGLFILIQKRYRAVGNFFNPVGVLLFSAAVFIWPYLLLQQVPEALTVWRTQTVGRAVGEMGHKPLWFYIPHIFWLTLPWTPFAIAAVPASWKRAWKEADARERFLWVWLLTQFAIVTISANKHKHYLNTALPMVSLLAGQGVSRLIARIRQRGWRYNTRTAVVCSGTFLVAGVAVALLGIKKWPELMMPFVLMGALVAVGGIIANGFARAKKPGMSAVALGVIFLGCYASMNAWIMPFRDHRQAVANFAQETRGELPDDQEISVYRMGETSVVYYLESPVQRMESQAALAKRLEEQGSLRVVTFETLASEVTATGKGRIIKRMTVSPGVPRPKHAPLVLIELTKAKSGSRLPTQTASENRAHQ